MLRILQKKSLYLSSCYRIPGIFNSFGSRNENMLSVVRSKFDKWVNFCLFFWKTSHWLLENRYTHTKEIDLFARQTRPRDSRCGVHDQTPLGYGKSSSELESDGVTASRTKRTASEPRESSLFSATDCLNPGRICGLFRLQLQNG